MSEINMQNTLKLKNLVGTMRKNAMQTSPKC